MSIFQSFQTGLALGQQQRKDRDRDMARQSAAEAFKAGNYEMAPTALMEVGDFEAADAYTRAGDRAKTEKRRETYGQTFKTGGWTGLGELAASEGDFETAGYAQGQARAKTLQDWEDHDRAITVQKQGVEFLATSAGQLRSLPLEARGQAAMDIIAQSPFADNPQVMQAVQQAAADGRITDEELTAFEEQMLTYAQKLEGQRWQKSFDQGVTESQRSYDLQAELGRGGLALERERLNIAKEEAESKSITGARYLTPDELKAAGYPEGAVVQVDAKGEDSVRFKPSAEFSAGEIKGFRDKYNVLSEFDRTLNEYKTLVASGGLKKLHKPDDVDAAKLDALKQSLTFQAKDLLNLGILSKDDYENLDRLIPDATGLGAMWKNKDSFNASISPLEATITSQLGMIPEQYRGGNSAAMTAPNVQTSVAAAPQIAQSSNMPFVDNPASYEAVPPGGYYVGPDGQTRQKPHYLPIGGQ